MATEPLFVPLLDGYYFGIDRMKETCPDFVLICTLR
jgi:hypothetical protein